MNEKIISENRKGLPGGAPENGSWFQLEKYRPKRIHDDSGYEALTSKEKQIYRVLCHHSYLTKKNHRRRYNTITQIRLALLSKCSLITVKRAVKKFIKSRLVIRWYKGTIETGASRYELPASRKQINYWRRHPLTKKHA